jgi:hypothetical protein
MDASPIVTKKAGSVLGNMCMKLYISDIRGLFDLPGIELLDEGRRNRVYRYHRPEDQARCLTAGAKDGKYYLVNRNNEILSEPYDFVSSVNSGVAIAKSGTQWVRIDTSGVPISGQAYSDVVLDDRGFFNRNERYFAKEGDLFALYDIEGNIVGGERFEDARLFTDKGFAAVKKDGQWGFVNVEGDLVIEPAYDDARSFSNDVAAVKIEDKWGFIDPEGKLVIEATFDEVKDFSGKGTCFVKIETKWRLLSLYRLNR